MTGTGSEKGTDMDAPQERAAYTAHLHHDGQRASYECYGCYVEMEYEGPESSGRIMTYEEWARLNGQEGN